MTDNQRQHRLMSGAYDYIYAVANVAPYKENKCQYGEWEVVKKTDKDGTTEIVDELKVMCNKLYVRKVFFGKIYNNKFPTFFSLEGCYCKSHATKIIKREF